MSPVYQKKEWYCLVFSVEYGPFPSEEEAWIAYEKIMNSGSCPTCEE